MASYTGTNQYEVGFLSRLECDAVSDTVENERQSRRSSKGLEMGNDEERQALQVHRGEGDIDGTAHVNPDEILQPSHQGRWWRRILVTMTVVVVLIAYFSGLINVTTKSNKQNSETRSGEDGVGVEPQTPPAPSNLDVLCDVSRVETESGYRECKDTCNGAPCCMALYSVGTGDDVDVGNFCDDSEIGRCDEYASCLVLTAYNGKELTDENLYVGNNSYGGGGEAGSAGVDGLGTGGTSAGLPPPHTQSSIDAVQNNGGETPPSIVEERINQFCYKDADSADWDLCKSACASGACCFESSSSAPSTNSCKDSPEINCKLYTECSIIYSEGKNEGTLEDETVASNVGQEYDDLKEPSFNDDADTAEAGIIPDEGTQFFSDVAEQINQLCHEDADSADLDLCRSACNSGACCFERNPSSSQLPLSAPWLNHCLGAPEIDCKLYRECSILYTGTKHDEPTGDELHEVGQEHDVIRDSSDDLVSDMNVKNSIDASTGRGGGEGEGGGDGSGTSHNHAHNTVGTIRDEEGEFSSLIEEDQINQFCHKDATPADLDLCRSACAPGACCFERNASGATSLPSSSHCSNAPATNCILYTECSILYTETSNKGTIHSGHEHNDVDESSNGMANIPAFDNSRDESGADSGGGGIGVISGDQPDAHILVHSTAETVPDEGVHFSSSAVEEQINQFCYKEADSATLDLCKMACASGSCCFISSDSSSLQPSSNTCLDSLDIDCKLYAECSVLYSGTKEDYTKHDDMVEVEEKHDLLGDSSNNLVKHSTFENKNKNAGAAAFGQAQVSANTEPPSKAAASTTVVDNVAEPQVALEDIEDEFSFSPEEMVNQFCMGDADPSSLTECQAACAPGACCFRGDCKDNIQCQQYRECSILYNDTNVDKHRGKRQMDTSQTEATGYPL